MVMVEVDFAMDLVGPFLGVLGVSGERKDYL